MLVVLPSSSLFCRKELGGPNIPTTKKKVSFFFCEFTFVLCVVFARSFWF
jgi:hypothetical protein